MTTDFIEDALDAAEVSGQYILVVHQDASGGLHGNIRNFRNAASGGFKTPAGRTIAFTIDMLKDLIKQMEQDGYGK